ncbi:hypothetical protein H6G89_31895 [Oscillatoria sp. FACHB-1407]|uniref:hypothetical protein n=1 Tax=Oscillatoria sp. FACHB-1407 TaxID=2692847 RepID=UPI00168538C6|nr:hypothetical protein [Oscillatoria sp. FACHB-1407]MBD2465598.1 hypothetical protein [Oscillatoria sp. FACHB-1407]
MQTRFAVGLVAILVPGQCAQLVRWLALAGWLPPMVLLLGVLMALLVGFVLWFQWLKWLDAQPTHSYYLQQLQQGFPLALALFGILLGVLT